MVSVRFFSCAVIAIVTVGISLCRAEDVTFQFPERIAFLHCFIDYRKNPPTRSVDASVVDGNRWRAEIFKNSRQILVVVCDALPKPLWRELGRSLVAVLCNGDD